MRGVSLVNERVLWERAGQVSGEWAWPPRKVTPLMDGHGLGWGMVPVGVVFGGHGVDRGAVAGLCRRAGHRATPEWTYLVQCGHEKQDENEDVQGRDH